MGLRYPIMGNVVGGRYTILYCHSSLTHKPLSPCKSSLLKSESYWEYHSIRSPETCFNLSSCCMSNISSRKGSNMFGVAFYLEVMLGMYSIMSFRLPNSHSIFPSSFIHVIQNLAYLSPGRLLNAEFWTLPQTHGIRICIPIDNPTIKRDISWIVCIVEFEKLWSPLVYHFLNLGFRWVKTERCLRHLFVKASKNSP